MQFEFIGFQYTITREAGAFRAEPVAGQHSAANKEKHCHAAVECYLSKCARIMPYDGGFVVYLSGWRCPPTFNSKGAAQAYRDKCIRERRVVS